MRKAQVVLLCTLLVPALASAQLNTTCAPSLPVSMTLSSELSSTMPSATVGFRALMQNESAELIPDAVLAVDILENNTGAIVDRFVVPQTVTLLAESAGKLDFVWKSPVRLPSGEYTVLATLAAADTPRAEVFSRVLQPMASLRITIQEGAPQASISAVRVNGNSYETYAPIGISGTSAQVVGVTINGTSAPYQGTLTWRLYAPEATLADAPLATKVEMVELHPGRSKEVPYVLSQIEREGYYLEGHLSNGKGNNYIDIWLERDEGVFGVFACAPAGASLGLNTTTVTIIALALLLLLFVGWRLYERKQPEVV